MPLLQLKSVDYLRLMMLTKPRKFVSAQIVVIMSTVHGYTSCPKFPNDIIGKTCMNDLSDIIIILDTPHIRIISIDCIFLAEILWWIVELAKRTRLNKNPNIVKAVEQKLSTLLGIFKSSHFVPENRWDK